MKFSIVIPVYNVEKYIDKCLNSIQTQSYENFEVIVVNDGTKDNSQKIIDRYVKKDKRFKSFIKENGGLSDARNYGVKQVSGDYLIFIDSDDYIEKNLLQNLNDVLSSKKYDIIKYKLNIVTEEGNLISKENGFDMSFEANLQQILSLEYCEPAWSYCYNLKFWKKHKFEYEKGKIHEDFGLTPLVLSKTKKIYYLNYFGYNYVQRPGSIVNGSEKSIKRVDDTLYHYDNLYKKIINDNNISKYDKKFLISFISNGIFNKLALLDKKNLKKYILEIKKRNIANNLLDDSLSRKLKKYIIKFFPYFYIKIFCK